MVYKGIKKDYKSTSLQDKKFSDWELAVSYQQSAISSQLSAISSQCQSQSQSSEF